MHYLFCWRRCNIDERAGNSVTKILGGLLEAPVDILVEVMHVLAPLAVLKSTVEQALKPSRSR